MAESDIVAGFAAEKGSELRPNRKSGKWFARVPTGPRLTGLQEVLQSAFREKSR